MTDDVPRRPLDHHVEPLFAGLGVEPPQRPRDRRRGALVANALLASVAVAVAAALLVWWLA